jgi:hypothetical protein
MTPIEKCKMLYTADSPRTFEEDMLAHLLRGYFFSTPEYVLMARPVSSDASQDTINNVWISFAPSVWDTWYIYAFALRDDVGLAGLVKKLLRHIPFYLPLIAWERSGHPLTFFPTDKLTNKYAKLSFVQD